MAALLARLLFPELDSLHVLTVSTLVASALSNSLFFLVVSRGRLARTAEEAFLIAGVLFFPFVVFVAGLFSGHAVHTAFHLGYAVMLHAAYCIVDVITSRESDGDYVRDEFRNTFLHADLPTVVGLVILSLVAAGLWQFDGEPVLIEAFVGGAVALQTTMNMVAWGVLAWSEEIEKFLEGLFRKR